jgi:hypothetical protein
MKKTEMTYQGKIESLIDFLKGEALCPCCELHDRCAQDCTYEADCLTVGQYSRFERMNEVRSVLEVVA